ncbi:hypothetical protein F4604DRAFT_1922239 [Suillus subluteus]|nr:hypothetical protein F4604DRAFT_1922239 [Suillus subluteus]
MPRGSKQSKGVQKAKKDADKCLIYCICASCAKECGKQGKKIPAWLERKHHKAAGVKKSRKMGSDNEDDDNEIISFEEIAAARKPINDTYKAQPSSQATGKKILQVDDPPTIAVALSPTQAIKQTCSGPAFLSDCVSGPSTDNLSLPTPGQVQIDSLMDDDDHFNELKGSPMLQDIKMQGDIKEFVDDYNFQLDDRLFSGVGDDHDSGPFHSMPALAEVSDDEDDDDASVREISIRQGSSLNDLLDQNMADLLRHASIDDTAEASSNAQLPLPPDIRPPTVQPTHEEPPSPLPEPPLPPDIILDNATPHWFWKIILLLVAWLNLRYHLPHRAANLLLKVSASIFYGLGAFTVDDKPAQTLRTAFRSLTIFRSILCVPSA